MGLGIGGTHFESEPINDARTSARPPAAPSCAPPQSGRKCDGFPYLTPDEARELTGYVTRAAVCCALRRRVEFLELRKTDMRPAGISVGFDKAKAGDALRRGLIDWTPALRQLFAELAQMDRRARDGKSAIPESMFVFTNRDGQPYTEQGFKALWSKIMADWVKVPGGCTTAGAWSRSRAAPDTYHHRLTLPPFGNEKRHSAFA